MLLAIKAKPNSRENRIKREGENWVVKVTAAPHDGEANDAIVRFLAEVFKIPKSQISIVGGATSSFKRISIPDEYSEKVKKVLELVGSC